LKLCRLLKFIVPFALVASTVAAIGGIKTEWNYQSYDIRNNLAVAPGYITLYEAESGTTLKIFVPNMIKCFQQTRDATVERTEKTITITTTPAIDGCDQIRFVLKADGTGGTRQTRVNDKWVIDKRERVLTIKN
jgi:hypothetical protein